MISLSDFKHRHAMRGRPNKPADWRREHLNRTVMVLGAPASGYHTTDGKKEST